MVALYQTTAKQKDKN